MIFSLLAICLWVVAAFIMQSIPSNDQHWRRAYVLIGVGVPLLIWVTWYSGPLMGALGLVVGAMVLRWPLLFLLRWMRRQIGL
ncbi:DUF2484 family protein [Yoonia sediminilitoris]|uniref:Uncharacterized protein DUF2484 n=1 Tax=Yoonia sediminilitoris TaxID=1286148 RepID=A0A2T6KQK0_9RHOB|nr:DUF2484 family protein [Yoonia sediminilitoris]PUB18828.1 uncharacterized protein DUF2484 [Yoonia sediminilitoris]RCW98996.1 uncharacterized protein DUF2484 [Yoonia sediminilitoris]